MIKNKKIYIIFLILKTTIPLVLIWFFDNIIPWLSFIMVDRGYSGLFFDLGENIVSTVIVPAVILIITYFLFRSDIKNNKILFKYNKKILLIIPVLLIILQVYNIFIDMYNFRQLEKAKPILENISKDAKTFYGLKEFNEIYSADIEPIKNCYDVTNYNGNEPYIFGFQLESFLYIYIYNTRYYSYPKYDAPYVSKCVSGIGCYDDNIKIFKRIISNPCKGNISGYAYEDINKNGIKDKNEKGIRFVKIYIDKNNDGYYYMEPYEYSNMDGYYEFDRLKSGNYKIGAAYYRGVLSPEDGYYDVKIGRNRFIENINFGVPGK